MRRIWPKALAAIFVLAALAGAAGLHYLRRSLPQIDGTIRVAGGSAPIEIVRDADAIPHVFAANKADALFGLGYLHAQDRLWQIELQRRIGYGRLSEVLGEAALPQDRFLRTVGFGRAARSAWEATAPWARQQIEWYVAGVNAFIASHHGAGLPPEFTLLGFEPEPFTGADVLVWVKMMAWDLSANYSLELLRHDLVATVGAERMNQLMPPYPADGLSILGAGRQAGGGLLRAGRSPGPRRPRSDADQGRGRDSRPVPVDRPQSPEVCVEHLPGGREGLYQGDAAHPSLEEVADLGSDRRRVVSARCFARLGRQVFAQK